MKRNNGLSTTLKRQIGERLTRIMQEKGKSRTEIRHILETQYNYHISRQTFSKYQSGVNWMPTEFMELVSKILGVDIKDIIGEGVRDDSINESRNI